MILNNNKKKKKTVCIGALKREINILFLQCLQKPYFLWSWSRRNNTKYKFNFFIHTLFVEYKLATPFGKTKGVGAKWICKKYRFRSACAVGAGSPEWTFCFWSISAMLTDYSTPRLWWMLDFMDFKATLPSLNIYIFIILQTHYSRCKHTVSWMYVSSHQTFLFTIKFQWASKGLWLWLTNELP